MINKGNRPIEQFMGTPIGQFFDYVPIASTAINLAGLVEKAIYKGEEPQFEKIRESLLSRLRKKISLGKGQSFRKMVLLTPFIGNIIVGGYDAIKSLIAKRQKIEPLIQEVNKGNPQAQYELGCRYADGIGIKKNLKEAARFFKLAANQRLPEAQNALAELCERGEGVPQNTKEAYTLYTAAANQGSVEALFHLGRLHHIGIYVPKEFQSAKFYYKLAANQGSTEAQINLGWLLEGNNQLVEAFKYYEQAAEKSSLGKCHLARCYEEGIAINKNLKKANQLYRKAGLSKKDQLKKKDYYELIAKEYETGKSIAQDQTKAQSYYQKAANLGSKTARKSLKPKNSS